MRAFLAALAISFGLIAVPALAANPPMFNTEQEAQAHCPKDVVVWVNLPTGVYHFRGERWYGNTKTGAFACQKEADQAGDRATRNGQ